MTEKILNFKNKDKYTVSDIAELVEILRSEDGCAWDREQTHGSIRNAMIEETYEFIEGLDADDKELMQEELGDVIFQVFFHARIAEESGRFNVDDIADGICKKMVLRHPHVFGDVTVANSAEVLKNWEEIKKSEKNRDSVKKDLESVPSVLPSLIRAEKLLSRFKKNGGKVEKDTAVLVSDLKNAVNALGDTVSSDEMGEILFKLANLTYASDINAEQALYEKNERFVKENSK